MSAAGVTNSTGAAEARTELALQPHELKQADGPAELDEQIDIAVRSAFIPGERTEQRQTGDTKGLQQGTTLTQSLKGCPHVEAMPVWSS